MQVSLSTVSLSLSHLTKRTTPTVHSPQLGLVATLCFLKRQHQRIEGLFGSLDLSIIDRLLFKRSDDDLHQLLVVSDRRSELAELGDGEDSDLAYVVEKALAAVEPITADPKN